MYTYVYRITLHALSSHDSGIHSRHLKKLVYTSSTRYIIPDIPVQLSLYRWRKPSGESQSRPPRGGNKTTSYIYLSSRKLQQQRHTQYTESAAVIEHQLLKNPESKGCETKGSRPRLAVLSLSLSLFVSALSTSLPFFFLFSISSSTLPPRALFPLRDADNKKAAVSLSHRLLAYKYHVRSRSKGLSLSLLYIQQQRR